MPTRRRDADATIARALFQELESLSRAGLSHLPKAAAVAAAASTPGPLPAAVAASKPSHPSVLAVRDDGALCAAAMEALAQQVAQCTRCAELARTRTQTVCGDGNPCTRLVFMGEAPGADEDRKGLPFVGAAGQLLDKIIAACGLRRQDVYILNTLKCRPPGNRTPLPEEAANCRPFLDAQLEIIRPEFICCLGAVAAQNLLATDVSIGRLRGRLHDYKGIKVVCTYHPAYLLRNPSAKRQTWDDMQMLMAEMGIEIPKR